MAQRIEISDVLLSDIAMLKEIVSETNHGEQDIKFTTDAGNLIARRATLSTELVTYGLSIVLDINNNLLTFTGTLSLDKATVTNGVAEALHDIADAMQAGAAEIRESLLPSTHKPSGSYHGLRGDRTYP